MKLLYEYIKETLDPHNDSRPTPPEKEFFDGPDILAGYILVRESHGNMPICYAPITRTDGPDRPFLVRTTDTKWLVPFGFVRAIYPQVEDALNWVDSKEDWRNLGPGARGEVNNFSWEWLEEEPNIKLNIEINEDDYVQN